jgi:AraC-like DNA-binding protein
MREVQVLVRTPAVSVASVRCCETHAGWSAEEPVATLGVVLVRSGVFLRRVDGVEVAAEPGAGYVQRPGSIQQMAHPCGGDRCTVITLSRSLLGSVLDRRRPDVPVFTASSVDVAHRMLVARAGQGADRFELAERATVLAGVLLAGLRDGRAHAAQAAVGPRSRRLAEQARLLLAEDTDRGLDDLARAVGVSAYHLSRTFRGVTGLTLSRYRIRLRLRRVLERLADGEQDLAGLAVKVGFADQSHLTRTMRVETGATPAALRALLTARHHLTDLPG